MGKPGGPERDATETMLNPPPSDQAEPQRQAGFRRAVAVRVGPASAPSHLRAPHLAAPTASGTLFRFARRATSDKQPTVEKLGMGGRGLVTLLHFAHSLPSSMVSKILKRGCEGLHKILGNRRAGAPSAPLKIRLPSLSLIMVWLRQQQVAVRSFPYPKTTSKAAAHRTVSHPIIIPEQPLNPLPLTGNSSLLIHRMDPPVAVAKLSAP